MNERRLPVPVRAAGTLLTGLLPDAVGRRSALRLVLKTLTEGGLRPTGARLRKGAAVVVVDASPPERRATAVAATYARFGRGLPGGLRVLTSSEYVLWSARGPGRRTAALPADWGELPPAPSQETEDDARRRRLREASGLLLHDLPAALASIGRVDGGRARALDCAHRLRTLLERVAPPAGFPPLPGPDARARELHCTSMGAAHVAFSAASSMHEPGPSLAPDHGPEAPARTRAAASFLFAPLLADLGGPTRGALRTLAILSGPIGTRHAWTLLALVDDHAPLHRAAAVREALQGHVGMLPRRALKGGTSPAAPVVLTESTFAAMLRGRLFRRPLRRLAIRMHRIVLYGPDPVPSDLPGLDASDDDRRAEIAALIEATSTAWGAGRTAVGTEDLVFGAWPAVLHHSGYGDPCASQASILEAMARRTDPALARVGSAADRRPWGDLAAGDLGRAAGSLRDWGPALIRLQEVAVESFR